VRCSGVKQVSGIATGEKQVIVATHGAQPLKGCLLPVSLDDNSLMLNTKLAFEAFKSNTLLPWQFAGGGRLHRRLS